MTLVATDYMNESYISAITHAANSIVRNHLGTKTAMKAPIVTGREFESRKVSVIMGIHGHLEGQVICTMDTNTAHSVVGCMMGGQLVETLDALGWSAIQEFGNWMAGSLSSELEKAGIQTDISPPMINEGVSTFRMDKTFLTFPMTSSLGELDIHVSLTSR